MAMRMIRSWAAVALCVLTSIALASCANERKTYSASGQKGYAVSCRGFMNNWNTCLVKAGQICGASGYDVVNEDQYDRAMFISCKSNTPTAIK